MCTFNKIKDVCAAYGKDVSFALVFPEAVQIFNVYFATI